MVRVYPRDRSHGWKVSNPTRGHARVRQILILANGQPFLQPTRTTLFLAFCSERTETDFSHHHELCAEFSILVWKAGPFCGDVLKFMGTYGTCRGPNITELLPYTYINMSTNLVSPLFASSDQQAFGTNPGLEAWKHPVGRGFMFQRMLGLGVWIQGANAQTSKNSSRIYWSNVRDPTEVLKRIILR